MNGCLAFGRTLLNTANELLNIIFQAWIYELLMKEMMVILYYV